MVCGRGTQSILRARGRWLAWSSGPSTSPLEVAPRIDLRMRHEIEEPRPRPFVMGNLVRARGTAPIHFGGGVLVARLCFGVRARTVASMRAPSNKRWRVRAGGLVRLEECRCSG